MVILGSSLYVQRDNLNHTSQSLIASIDIKYPRNSFAPLIPIKGLGIIGVEEGLFWVLQKEGWLHSGYVEWRAPYSG